MWDRGDEGGRAVRRPQVEDIATTTGGPSPSSEQIRTWLIRKLAEILEVEPGQVDPSMPLDWFGLDSVGAVDLTAAIEKWLGREFSPTLAYEHPTVDALATFLADQLSDAP
jgi:acyl carrier protein